MYTGGSAEALKYWGGGCQAMIAADQEEDTQAGTS